MTSPAPRAAVFAGQVDVVWLAGEDRLDFLRRMSTGHLDGLGAYEGRGTVVVTDTARAVDLVAAHASPTGIALVTSGPGAAPAVASHLRRYVLYRDRVRVTDASAQVRVFRLLGPDALDVAAEAAGLPAADLPPGGWREQGSEDETVWLLRHVAPGGLGGADLVVPAGAPAARMAARLAAIGAGPPPQAEVGYSAARVQAGLPAFGAEMDGEANPLELDLRDLVDFGKGCYIGQEVVARLDTYDRVQRRLVGLRSPAILSPGDAVRAVGSAARGPRAVGRITTAAPAAALLPPSEATGWLALALVPRAVSPGAAVRVDTAAGPIETIAEPPGRAPAGD